MSEQKKAIIKERLSAARKLAKEGRYDAARYILEQVEHPKAKTMLKALEGYEDKESSVPLFSPFMIFGIVVGIVAIFGLLAALILIPPTFGELQANKFERFFSGRIAMYCKQQVRASVYEDELCEAWKQVLIENYRDSAIDCFNYEDEMSVILSNYETVSFCLNRAGVPSPRDQDFYNESIGNITLSDEEVRYANLANYCYNYTGYGGELCLDWTEMVLADYADGLDNCLAPLIDADMPTDEIYAKVGTCLTDAGVPPPL